MVSGHEQTHFANFVADTPEDRRVERGVDQGVVNVHDGYVAEFGDPDRPVPRDAAAIARAGVIRHVSHRGGRAFPAPDEPEFRIPTYESHTPEELQSIQDGIASLRELARGAQLRRVALGGNPDEVRQVLAVHRRNDDRRAGR